MFMTTTALLLYSLLHRINSATSKWCNAGMHLDLSQHWHLHLFKHSTLNYERMKMLGTQRQMLKQRVICADVDHACFENLLLPK